MAELVEDPVLRQRYLLTLQGDVLRNELWAEPGSEVPEHLHPGIEERFEILEGEWTFKVDGEERAAGPGDRLVVPAGARHTFKNTGSDVGHFVVEIEPGSRMKELFEESAAMARAGKYTARGLPAGPGAVLDIADFADRYGDVMVVTSPPPALQRIMLAPLMPLVRRRRAGRGER